MTREEAIEIINRENDPNDTKVWEVFPEYREALDMAIQALSQEPMREFTEEEAKAYSKALDKMYKPTGFNVFDEPCDDTISRDFQIGDEVRIIGSDPIYDDCDVGWVIRNASEKVKTMYVMRNDGSADEEAKVEWYKTGRHNAVLAEVIKALPSVTQKSETVTEFADRCRECGAKYGKYRKEAKRWKNKWLKSQKSGKWIAQDIHNCHTDFRCSECGYIHSFMHLYGEPTADYTYCPNCGCRMYEPQESKAEKHGTERG